MVQRGKRRLEKYNLGVLKPLSQNFTGPFNNLKGNSKLLP